MTTAFKQFSLYRVEQILSTFCSLKWTLSLSAYCTLSWRILELSIAMAYSMLSVYGKKNRSISAAAAVLRGFNSVNPLSELERRHLILLVSSRLACS